MRLLSLLNETGSAFAQLSLGEATAADVGAWIVRCRIVLSARVDAEQAMLFTRRRTHALLEGNLVPAGKVEMIRTLESRANEHRRLWRSRGRQAVPDIWADVMARRRREARLRQRQLMRSNTEAERVIRDLQRQLGALWPKPLRRCAYPGCAVAGGRFFVGRTKDCPDCRRRYPARKTRYRHRLTGGMRARAR